MSFEQFLTVLRARWKSALGVWLALVALVAGGSLLITPNYMATAVVLVDVRTTDPLAGNAPTGAILPGYMATQLDIAQSERVIVRAIRALHLHENAEVRAQWNEETKGRGDLESWLASRLTKRFEVRPARDSNTLTLAYTAPDPNFAATMTDALMKAYIDTTLELRVEPARQYNTFFDERSKQLRSALEAAQSKLSTYQAQNGLSATDERFDLENTRLLELSSALVAAQAAAAESGGRQAQVAANGERMQEVLNNPMVVQLGMDLARQEAQLKDVNSRLGNEHPQVVALREGISELRRRLGEATRLAAGSMAVSNSVALSRVAETRASLEQQRSKVLRLRALRDEAAVLQRDAENAQRSYEIALARSSQTDAESQNRQTNVSVLKRATVPATASSPRVLLNTTVAFVLGFLLAVGTVLLREMRDRRLRTAEDVVQSLGQQLLVILPRSRLTGTPDSARTRSIERRVVSGQQALP